MERRRIEVEIIVNASVEDLEQVTHDRVPWVFDTETTGLEVAGDSSPHKMRYFGAGPLNNVRVCYVWRSGFFTEDHRRFFNRRPLIAHNAQFDILAARLKPTMDVVDTMGLVYHNDTVALKSLDNMCRVMGIPKIKTPDLIKEGRIDEVLPELVYEYLADDVAATSILANRMLASGQRGWDVQFQALKVLTKAQDRGVLFIPEALEKVRPKVEASYHEARGVLHNMGFDGNLGSPLQLSTWMRGRGVKLPQTEASLGTDKPRYSTKKMVLERLMWEGNEEARYIILARKRLKLMQAFLNTLPEKVRADGRVYPNINMFRTKTGRLSYSNPNLQQIPKHDELGKGLRACFTGPRGFLDVVDYSQVEMRVAAALSGDPVLLDIFDRGEDLHAEVACAVLGCSPKSLTDEQRFGAKAINFGILNGMGARRLSHELKSDVGTAQRWLDAYRDRFSVMANWMDTTWADAQVGRVVKTLSGRTRIFRRDEGIRSAVSVKVQGTAADLLYGAVVAVDKAGIPVLFSVHDEIATNSRDPEMLREVMEDAANKLFPKELGAVKFKAEGYHNTSWQQPPKND